MIFDFCSGVGSFPFRHVSAAEPGALIQRMDREGIDQALVWSFECLLYRNVQAGNDLLVERLKGLGDRLLPSAVINPIYGGALADTELCLSGYGMRALRLFPNFHAYDLGDKRVASVIEIARQYGVPVCVSTRVEDDRQHHWLLPPASLPVEDIAKLIKQFPDVSFVIERAASGEVTALAEICAGAENWFTEICRLQAKPGAVLNKTVETLGANRVLFGTNAPVFYHRCALLNVRALSLPEAEEKAILGGNARRLLRV